MLPSVYLNEGCSVNTYVYIILSEFCHVNVSEYHTDVFADVKILHGYNVL